MEINSLRWPTNLLQRDNSRQAKIEKPLQQAESRQSKIVFHVPEVDERQTDFSSISPRELRALAWQNYQAGRIDQETFLTLSEELPMHAIDAHGQVLDLSGITDDTGFDFRNYYRDQLQIAMSLGDAPRAEVLKSVLAFIEI